MHQMIQSDLFMVFVNVSPSFISLFFWVCNDIHSDVYTFFALFFVVGFFLVEDLSPIQLFLKQSQKICKLIVFF